MAIPFEQLADQAYQRVAPLGYNRDAFLRLAEAVQQQESGGNPRAVSPKGALGTMQTMPDTLRDPGYGVRPARDDSDLERTRVGLDYLAAMIEANKGNWINALGAYNAGPGTVQRYGGLPPYRETQGYVEKIINSLIPAAQADELPAQRQTTMPKASYPDPADYGGRFVDPAEFGGRILESPAPTPAPPAPKVTAPTTTTAPTSYPDPAKYGGRIVGSTAPVETAPEPAPVADPNNPWAEPRNIHLLGRDTGVRAPNWLAGKGRGIMDVLQGGKQFGLQIGEQLGFVPEGRTADYTQQVQAEMDAYNKNYGDSTSASVGRFAGTVLPTLPVGGGVVGGALKRAGTAALAGGAIGSAQFVPEGASRLGNTLLGAVTGGAVSGAMSGIGKTVNALRGDTIPAQADEIIKLGQQQKVPVFYPDVGGSPAVRELSTTMEKAPLVGMVGPRVNQNKAAKEAAERLRDRLSPIASDEVGDTLQRSLANKLSRAKQVDDQLFTKVANIMDPAGTLPATGMTQRAADLLRAELAKKPEYQDKEVIALLRKYSVDPSFNFSGLKELRSDLFDQVNSFYTGRNAVIGQRGVHVLQDIKDALEMDMAMAAQQQSPTAWKSFRKAAEFHKKNVVPYIESADIRAAVKTGDADEIFNKFIRAGKGDRARRLYERLDQEGRGALRFGMVDQAYQKAISRGPDGEVFSTAQFAKELQRLSGPAKKVFNSRDFDEIQGLVKLMEHVKRSGQVAESPPTGNRLVQILLAVLGTGGAFMAPGPTAAAAGGVFGLKTLFTTRAGRNLLLSSSRLRVGSPAMDRLLANQAPKIAAVGAVDAVTNEDDVPR